MKLNQVICDYLKNQGLDFIDLIYRYETRDLFLRILVDKPEGGITLDECANLNNEISRILDEQDLVQQRYILEVSSPGVDRILKTKNDFTRCIKRKARFFLLSPINGKSEWEGVITRVDENCLYLDVNGDVIEVPLSKINKAKQIISN